MTKIVALIGTAKCVLLLSNVTFLLHPAGVKGPFAYETGMLKCPRHSAAARQTGGGAVPYRNDIFVDSGSGAFVGSYAFGSAKGVGIINSVEQTTGCQVGLVRAADALRVGSAYLVFQLNCRKAK